MTVGLYPFSARFLFVISHISESKSIPMECIPIDSASSRIVPVPQKGSHNTLPSFNRDKLTIHRLSFQSSSCGRLITFLGLLGTNCASEYPKYCFVFVMIR